jgi:hypothetical protein
MNDEEFHRILMEKLGDKAFGSIIAGCKSDRVIEDPSLSKMIPDAKAIGSEPYVMSPELEEKIKKLIEIHKETLDRLAEDD